MTNQHEAGYQFVNKMFLENRNTSKGTVYGSRLPNICYFSLASISTQGYSFYRFKEREGLANRISACPVYSHLPKQICHYLSKLAIFTDIEHKLGQGC